MNKSQDTQLKEIKDRTERIEASLKKVGEISRYYFLFGIGLTGMAAGMALSVANPKYML